MASENENASLIADSNAVMWIQHCRAVASDISIFQNNICVALGELDLNEPSVA